jgi:S-formylglutathione hydrolase
MTESRLIESSFEDSLVPNPVEYAVLLPKEYDDGSEFPLLFFLHGGRGDRTFLNRTRPRFDDLWEKGLLPPLVVVTPSVSQRCFYMDYKDGTENWEQFVIGPFLEHLRQTYSVSNKRESTFISGVSMGGMGTLRIGLKHPELFAAMAALEPGIEPALAFKDIKLEDRFWRQPELFEVAFGKPVDEAYWQANNPANIVMTQADNIRNSGIAIYLECGDEDAFGLHRGTEFLHRVLWDHNIKHEYHLVRGGEHVGKSVGPRISEALQFITRVINPPEQDPFAEKLRIFNEAWLKDVQSKATDQQN